MTTLLAFVVLGLLGLRVNALFGLPVIPAWPYNYLGIVPVLVGVALRFWASFTIFNMGEGTPLYNRPPKSLVTTGPYRLIRNPLYLGGFLIYLGILITTPSLFLVILGLIGLPITYVGVSSRGERFGETIRRELSPIQAECSGMDSPNYESSTS